MKNLLILFSLFFVSQAFTQSTSPILRLETGMHTAMAGRISTDKLGRYVLTCSNDKTARLWSATSGELLEIYRLPIGIGNVGMLYACALSPDGRYVAVGGYFNSGNHNIFIFHTQTGILQHCIGGLGNVILDLEFSSDGRYLAAALAGTQGIRVYQSSTWGLEMEDQDYLDNVHNLVFRPKGGLATVSYDGYIRLYDAKFILIKKNKTTGGTQPFSLAISPDGNKMAVGYSDSPRMQILDARSLQLLYEPELGLASELNHKLNVVSFSQDGKRLIAGGYYKRRQEDGKYWRLIKIWDNTGRGNNSEYPIAGSSVSDIKIMPTGHVLYSSAQPDWGILDPDSGERIVYQEAALNDHNIFDRSHLRISDQGTMIGWTPAYEDPLSFDVESRKLKEATVAFSSFQDKLQQLAVADWKNTYSPKLDGKAISILKEREITRSVDIAERGQTIVLGTNWNVYAIDREGKQLWKSGTQTETWAVNIAGNQKVVVACMGNGTLRWYRMSDGQLLLSLYVHPDRKQWVLWTPSGYYDASAGAENFLGWHVNQGEDTEALFYPVSKFRKTYYRPDVIDRILLTVDEDKALRLANERAQRASSQRNITQELPPTVRILQPATGSKVGSNSVQLEYSLQSPNKEPITSVKILLDGRPISFERGLKASGQRETVQIRIPSENCTVSVIAENRFGTSPEASINLFWDGELSFLSSSMKPDLYILAVGVGDYNDDSYDLDYPDDDAEGFVKVLKAQEGLLYNKVKTKLFTNKDATKDNILDGLDWLIRETTQHDVAMLFFAGHGVEDTRGTFFYLPVEADQKALRRTALMESDIQETVAVVTGKILVFMDACHSGNLMASNRRRGNPNIDRIVNELIQAENGAVVYSSSTGRQSSLENSAWGHGAFTKALIEGLGGKAVHQSGGKVTCKSLDYYISHRVKQLTQGDQTPTTNYPPNVPDFPISIIK